MINPTARETKHVALYGSRQQEGHISAIWTLVESLVGAGMGVSIEKKLADTLASEGYRPAVHGVNTCTRLPEDTDMAISVGGDGTFLRTARWLGGREIPILGINTGHLGFLAEHTTDHIKEVTDLILSGDYDIERRLVLEVEFEESAQGGGARRAVLYALNEAAFMKGAASMIDIDVKLDGLHLSTYRADGLLVATPTGSTAYNLSVGGPILAPALECVVLSPIAPHTLTMRPVVVGGDSRLEAVVTSRAREFRLNVDGHSVALPCGTPVKIRKAPHAVLTVRRRGENFASTLRSKLSWGQ